jgi:hypothetical protein
VVFLSSWEQIVDSVIALFRVDFSGRGELAERQVFSSIHFDGSFFFFDQYFDGSWYLVKMLKGAVFICLFMCICCEIAAKASTDAVPTYQDC